MNTPLHRLYKTKLLLLAVLLVVAGVFLLLVPSWLGGMPGWEWMLSVPLGELGSALFIAGFVTIAMEYVDRHDAEQRGKEWLRQIFKEQAPALRDSMLEVFATNADTLKSVASPETLEGLARNSLAIQLGDAELAHDVYDDLREQVIRAGQRWRDVSVGVSLMPWADGPAAGQGSMFVATISWEYRTKLDASVQRFSCVSDLDEYRQLLHDPTSTLVWYFEPIGDLTAATPAAFELLQFTIDGKPRTIRRGKRTRSQTFTVDTSGIGEDREVSVAYTFRVLVQRHSHMLQLDITQPAKGLKVQFAYGDCGIRHVNVLDFIAGSEQPRILRSPAATTPVIHLAYDGWVWPKSGVGFGWVLEGEVKRK